MYTQLKYNTDLGLGHRHSFYMYMDGARDSCIGSTQSLRYNNTGGVQSYMRNCLRCTLVPQIKFPR